MSLWSPVDLLSSASHTKSRSLPSSESVSDPPDGHRPDSSLSDAREYLSFAAV